MLCYENLVHQQNNRHFDHRTFQLPTIAFLFLLKWTGIYKNTLSVCLPVITSVFLPTCLSVCWHDMSRPCIKEWGQVREGEGTIQTRRLGDMIGPGIWQPKWRGMSSTLQDRGLLALAVFSSSVHCAHIALHTEIRSHGNCKVKGTAKFTFETLYQLYQLSRS